MRGEQLSAEQLAVLKSERVGKGGRVVAELLAEVEVSFTDAAERIRVLARPILTFHACGPETVADFDWGR